MALSQANSSRTRRLLAAALPLAALLGVLVLVGGDASAAKTKASLLGKTKSRVNADCPKEPCRAIGSVTGFQKEASGRDGAFKMPVAGKLVAWSVDVANTSNSQSDFFGELFQHDKLGQDPYARLAILRRKTNKDGRFRLRSQSPKINLIQHEGSRVVFAMRRPLGAAKGDVVGVTIPTWAAILDSTVSNRNKWLASRDEDCDSQDPDVVSASRPQQKIGSLRRYGCNYTARLTYWAYYVRKDEQDKGDGKKKDGGGN